MFITLYIINGLLLVLIEKRKKNIVYAAGNKKTAAYSHTLYDVVFWLPAAYSVWLYAAVFGMPAAYNVLFYCDFKPQQIK